MAQTQLRVLVKGGNMNLSLLMIALSTSMISQTEDTPAMTAQVLQRGALTRLSPKHLNQALPVVPKSGQASGPAQVMAFVSLSMPRPALESLLVQSARLRVPLVIRGIHADGFVATAKRVATLVSPLSQKGIHSGIAIDPNWFRTFHIREVPAFVSVSPGRCVPAIPCDPLHFDVVRGNVSMYDALTHLAEGQHGAAAATALMRMAP
ncbi:exported hypothetical protein [Vibrio nigripulchritudo SO65]|nr:exported hypothetical protein [Vibrio nigripulchritudo AM115]CCN44981.1 exported hypothetical protein [Vibrio nigripulchritudo FTn2]CCN79739.1 exported hypothetical protein [Vibrio nigripulchritudo SO65]